MNAQQEQWFNTLASMCHEIPRTPPTREDAIAMYERGLTPGQAFDELYPGLRFVPLEETQAQDSSYAVDVTGEREQSFGELSTETVEYEEPEVTEAQMLRRIASTTYTAMPCGRVVVCEITMANLYTFRGEAPVRGHTDRARAQAKGQALGNAMNKAMEFERYLAMEDALRARTSPAAIRRDDSAVSEDGVFLEVRQ